MKIVVFGGTGQTGQAVVQQALDEGHKVRVLARSPEKLSIKHIDLEVVKGDVCNFSDVKSVMQGQDAVVCAIGGNGLSDSTTRTDGTKNIVSSMKISKPNSLVVCSVLGLGKSKNHLSMMGKMVLNTILRNPNKDHSFQEEVVRSSDVDWVIIRPPRLVNSPKTEEYKLASEDEEQFKGTQISREDVAHCMLRALSEKSWVGKALSISY